MHCRVSSHEYIYWKSLFRLHPDRTVHQQLTYLTVELAVLKELSQELANLLAVHFQDHASRMNYLDFLGLNSTMIVAIDWVTCLAKGDVTSFNTPRSSSSPLITFSWSRARGPN